MSTSSYSFVMARKNCTEYPIQNYHCQLGMYAMAFGGGVKIILTVFSNTTKFRSYNESGIWNWIM